MSNHNVISLASRTPSQGRTPPQGPRSVQRVVQTKHAIDQRLAQMKQSQVRDLVAERHAKQIAEQLNAILGYGTHS